MWSSSKPLNKMHTKPLNSASLTINLSVLMLIIFKTSVAVTSSKELKSPTSSARFGSSKTESTSSSPPYIAAKFSYERYLNSTPPSLSVAFL